MTRFIVFVLCLGFLAQLQVDQAFACDLSQLENLVVLRHATGTHILDGNLNSLNRGEEDRSFGTETLEAQLTFLGIQAELAKTAAHLNKAGIHSENSCFVTSENARAVQTTAVIQDYWLNPDSIFHSWEKGEAEGDRRLTEKESAELLAVIAAQMHRIPTDRRLREAHFGPTYEGASYREYTRAGNLLVRKIRETSPFQFLLQTEKAEKEYLGERYETESIGLGKKYLREMTIDLSEESDTPLGQFQAESLRRTQTRVSEGLRATLGEALGTEPKEAIFNRALDYLRSPDGVRAQIVECCRRFSKDSKFNIIFSTHDSVGSQLISILKDGHDIYPRVNFKLRPAQAEVIPVQAGVFERLGWLDAVNSEAKK